MNYMTLYFAQITIWIARNNQIAIDGAFGRLWHFKRWANRQEAEFAVRRLNQLFHEHRGVFDVNLVNWKWQKFGNLSHHQGASGKQVNYMAKLLGVPRSDKATRRQLHCMSKAQADVEIKRLQSIHVQY